MWDPYEKTTVDRRLSHYAILIKVLSSNTTDKRKAGHDQPSGDHRHRQTCNCCGQMVASTVKFLIKQEDLFQIIVRSYFVQIMIICTIDVEQACNERGQTRLFIDSSRTSGLPNLINKMIWQKTLLIRIQKFSKKNIFFQNVF